MFLLLKLIKLLLFGIYKTSSSDSRDTDKCDINHGLC